MTPGTWMGRFMGCILAEMELWVTDKTTIVPVQ